MTEINKEEILHLAKLSRLSLDEEHVQEFSLQIKDIIKMANKLKEVDTEDVKPLFSNTTELNKFRSDVAETTNTRDELFENAPRQKDGFIVVPEILQGKEK